MVDQTLVQAIVIGGSILGGVGRQFLPWIRKMAAAESAGQTKPTYQHRYTFNLIFSVIVAAVVGIILYPQIIQNLPPNGSAAVIFFTSFLTAWGSTDLFANVAATGLGTGSGGDGTSTATAKQKSSTTTTSTSSS